MSELIIHYATLAGGGGMAQDSFLERATPFLAWGLFMLVVITLAVAALRRIYRQPGGDADSDAER